ncbi:metal-sensing transcriptional repressor, partial [Mycobacterium tuberculosis]
MPFRGAKLLLSPSLDMGVDRGFITVLAFGAPTRAVGSSRDRRDRWRQIPIRGIGSSPKTGAGMSHVEKEKKKLLNRLKRMRGQIEAIERAVEEDR